MQNRIDLPIRITKHLTMHLMMPVCQKVPVEDRPCKFLPRSLQAALQILSTSRPVSSGLAFRLPGEFWKDALAKQVWQPFPSQVSMPGAEGNSQQARSNSDQEFFLLPNIWVRTC